MQFQYLKHYIPKMKNICHKFILFHIWVWCCEAWGRVLLDWRFCVLNFLLIVMENKNELAWRKCMLSLNRLEIKPIKIHWKLANFCYQIFLKPIHNRENLYFLNPHQNLNFNWEDLELFYHIVCLGFFKKII